MKNLDVEDAVFAVKAKEIPHVQQEYTDIWELVKRFYRVQNDDSYWECVIQEANAYYKKHPTPNAKGLVLHFLEELERRWKEQYGISDVFRCRMCGAIANEPSWSYCPYCGTRYR